MNKKYIYILAGGIGVLLIVGVFLLLQKKPSGQQATKIDSHATQQSGDVPAQSDPANPDQQSPSQTQLSPEEVVKRFYVWYITYPGNPLATKAYLTNQYIADD